MLPPRHRLTKTRARIRQHTKGRRTFVQRRPGQSFEPTEDWHEPAEKAGYRVIVRNPGKGYRHVVTEDQIRDRLARLPQQFLKDLDVVQLACMTRKKNRFPYYGLQWGTAIYLYPFEENLEETFYRPPPRALVIEAKMFGGQIIQDAPGVWKLIWSESACARLSAKQCPDSRVGPPGRFTQHDLYGSGEIRRVVCNSIWIFAKWRAESGPPNRSRQGSSPAPWRLAMAAVAHPVGRPGSED